MASILSRRSRIQVKSGRITSTPGWCSSGNRTPQSTTRSRPACSKTVMLRPISPSPPSGTTRSPPACNGGRWSFCLGPRRLIASPLMRWSGRSLWPMCNCGGRCELLCSRSAFVGVGLVWRALVQRMASSMVAYFLVARAHMVFPGSPLSLGLPLAGGRGAPDPETRRLCQALCDDAVALRHCRKAREDLVVRIRVKLDVHLDVACSDGGVARDPKGAASVELALSLELGAADVDAERGRHASQSDTRAGQHGLQEHVAGAGVAAVAASGGMQAGADRAGPGLHGAGDAGVVECCARVQRCERTAWLVAVSLFEGSLHLAQGASVHADLHESWLNQTPFESRRRTARG